MEIDFQKFDSISCMKAILWSASSVKAFSRPLMTTAYRSYISFHVFFLPLPYFSHTVSIYVIPLSFIQLTENKQNLVCNNWYLKLQPAVILQNLSITASKHPIVPNRFLFITAGCYFNICCKQYFIYEQ